MIFSLAQQNTLKLSAGQKKRLDEIQKEIDSKIETLLTEGQKTQLQTLRRPAGPGGPGCAGRRAAFRSSVLVAMQPAFPDSRAGT